MIESLHMPIARSIVEFINGSESHQQDDDQLEN